MERRWIFPTAERVAAAERLERALGVSALAAAVLVRNGILDDDLAGAFLDPRLTSLGDPLALVGVREAAGRMWRAIDGGERIVLFGDYDVDGVASVAVLARLLRVLGGRVTTFLPSRGGEGYGLSAAAVENCLAETTPDLLVAVDCGTTSVGEIAALQRRGVDVLVLDHHEPAGSLPNCVVVNPKATGEAASLCSGGVVFKVAHGMMKLRAEARVDLRDFLDLIALATVADLVPLVGENRILVRAGLRRMERSRWPGVRALMAVADVGSPVTASDVGFRLGPRINAAGRLASARQALELLTTDDPAAAVRIADELDRQNRERQTVERALVRHVEAWIEAHFVENEHASIVAGEREWHHGVLGIVAARVMRRHHRPTLLVGFDEDGIGKGSGRSIEGVSIVDALRSCAGHLEKFGGHDMAAGVTVTEERFAAFREAFETAARALVDDELLTPKVRIDGEFSLGAIDERLLDDQDALQPFGNGNPRPVFALRAVSPSTTPRVLKEKHVKFEFGSGRRRVEAIFFNGAASPLPRPPWDVAFTLERNVFDGRESMQLQVAAIRSAA